MSPNVDHSYLEQDKLFGIRREGALDVAILVLWECSKESVAQSGSAAHFWDLNAGGSVCSWAWGGHGWERTWE